MASWVRQLMGWPSITWVPAVVTVQPGASRGHMAPAITERAALPVQTKTMWPIEWGRVSGAFEGGRVSGPFEWGRVSGPLTGQGTRAAAAGGRLRLGGELGQ